MTSRLHALCPYFAMFPAAFAREVIEQHSRVGDLVLDPFSGRGTTVLEALLAGRRAAGLDINPVAYCVTAAKATVPSVARVEHTIDGLEAAYEASTLDLNAEAGDLPVYFRVAFQPETLRQLLFLRSHLNWRRRANDRFVAAITMGILHGENGRSIRYLSNQLPRTISPKPDYSVRYWAARDLVAPRRDVFDALRSEIRFRLATETPSSNGVALLGDVRDAGVHLRKFRREVSLVLTSPPYLNLTSFEEDQWLRLWFLGYGSSPSKGRIGPDDRHPNLTRYGTFLRDAFGGVQPLLASRATLVLRVGAKNRDPQELVTCVDDAIADALPGSRRLGRPAISEIMRRQTNAFRPGSVGCRLEIDLTYHAAA